MCHSHYILHCTSLVYRTIIILSCLTYHFNTISYNCREGGREGDDYYTYSNRCVHIHSMHFIVGPMPSEIVTRISLDHQVFINTCILYIYSSSPPSFYFLLVNHLKMERIHMVHHYDKNNS